MTSEHFIGLVIIGLLVFQQIYYTLTINRLLNKLMSRNYSEFVQTEQFMKNTIPNTFKVDVGNEPEEDLSILSALGPQV